jgi:uncharacterized membrane protein YeiH
LVGCGLCGMFTATFGGLTRDVLIGRPPRILYATSDLGGAYRRRSYL